MGGRSSSVIAGMVTAPPVVTVRASLIMSAIAYLQAFI